MQDRDDDERDGGGDAVGCDRGHRGRQPTESIANQPSERRLTDPAEAERCEGDAELSSGDVAVERLNRASRQPSFAIPGAGELIEPRPARRHQRELGGHEEGVGEYEADDGGQADNDRGRPCRFHTI